MSSSSLSDAEETAVVALIARGQTYKEINQYMRNTYERSIAADTVTAIKVRNKETLAHLKTEIVAQTTSDTLHILNKANERLQERLIADERNTDMFKIFQDKFLATEITFKEYEKAVKLLPKSFFISTGELVAISKEMFAQSKGTETPAAEQIDPAQLAKAIQEGDTLTINQLIFHKNANA